MPIKITQKNGVNIANLEKEFSTLLQEYAQDNDPKKHDRLIEIHAILEEYKPNCHICQAGREALKSGLGSIIQGDVSNGLSKIKASFKTIGLKIDYLKTKK